VWAAAKLKHSWSSKVGADPTLFPGSARLWNPALM
jgi:hypothetical protein